MAGPRDWVHRSYRSHWFSRYFFNFSSINLVQPILRLGESYPSQSPRAENEFTENRQLLILFVFSKIKTVLIRSNLCQVQVDQNHLKRMVLIDRLNKRSIQSRLPWAPKKKFSIHDFRVLSWKGLSASRRTASPQCPWEFPALSISRALSQGSVKLMIHKSF